MRVKKGDFSASSEVDCEIPIKLSLLFSCFIPEAMSKNVYWHINQVSRRDCTGHMKLVKGVAGERQFLKIGDFYLDRCIRRNISNFQIQDIFAFRIQLAISSFLSLFDCFFVFFLRLFFFLYDTFNSCGSELC